MHGSTSKKHMCLHTRRMSQSFAPEEIVPYGSSSVYSFHRTNQSSAELSDRFWCHPCCQGRWAPTKRRKRDQPVQKYSAKTDAKISSRERNALRSVDPWMQSVDNDLLSKAIIMRSLLSRMHEKDAWNIARYKPVQIAPIIPDGIIASPTQFAVYFNLKSAISFPQSENRKN